MAKSHFRRRGLKVVVDTTEQAEFDFAGFQVPPAVQEAIARELKLVPKSFEDRFSGDIRLREIRGWDVAFVIWRENNAWVVTIIGADRPKEMEKQLNRLRRAGLAALPPWIQALLEERGKTQ